MTTHIHLSDILGKKNTYSIKEVNVSKTGAGALFIVSIPQLGGEIPS